jgi:hypothetical protein
MTSHRQRLAANDEDRDDHEEWQRTAPARIRYVANHLALRDPDSKRAYQKEWERRKAADESGRQCGNHEEGECCHLQACDRHNERAGKCSQRAADAPRERCEAVR